MPNQGPASAVWTCRRREIQPYFPGCGGRVGRCLWQVTRGERNGRCSLLEIPDLAAVACAPSKRPALIRVTLRGSPAQVRIESECVTCFALPCHTLASIPHGQTRSKPSPILVFRPRCEMACD